MSGDASQVGEAPLSQGTPDGPRVAAFDAAGATSPPPAATVATFGDAGAVDDDASPHDAATSLRLAARPTPPPPPLTLDVPRVSSAASELNSSTTTPCANTPISQRYTSGHNHGGSGAGGPAGPHNNHFVRRTSSGLVSASRQSTEESLCGLDGSPTSVVSAGSATFVVGAFRVSYCPICFEGFSLDNPAMVLACGHVFHVQCHLAWRQRSAACAVCQVVVEDSAARLMTVSDVQNRRKGLPPPPPSVALDGTAVAAPRPVHLRDADEVQMETAVREALLRGANNNNTTTNNNNNNTAARGGTPPPPEPGAPLAPQMSLNSTSAAATTSVVGGGGGRRGLSPSHVQYVAVVHAIDDDDEAAATQGPCPRGAAGGFLDGSSSSYGRRAAAAGGGGGGAKACGVLGSLQRFFSCFLVPKPQQQHQQRRSGRYGNAAQAHHPRLVGRSAGGMVAAGAPSAAALASSPSPSVVAADSGRGVVLVSTNGDGSTGVSIASTASLSSNGREMGFVVSPSLPRQETQRLPPVHEHSSSTSSSRAPVAAASAAAFHQEEERMAQQKAVRTS